VAEVQLLVELVQPVVLVVVVVQTPQRALALLGKAIQALLTETKEAVVVEQEAQVRLDLVVQESFLQLLDQPLNTQVAVVAGKTPRIHLLPYR
jgi:hypothetical protein